MARRELSPEELEYARRLKAIWLRKRKELGLTQEQVGLACGWSGQTAFEQYLNARRPLNVEAVLKLAKVLKVHPTEIMPSIAKLLPAESKPREDVSEEALELARMIEQLPSEQRAALRSAAQAFVDTAKKQDSKVKKA